MNNISIYADGAVSGNPGPGGYAAIIIDGDEKTTVAGRAGNTTNNRTEVLAVIVGIEALKTPSRVTIYTDSQYVVKTMTLGWKRNKNVDLWKRLDVACVPHAVSFIWVRGHSDNIMNNEVDRLAVIQRDLAKELD